MANKFKKFYLFLTFLAISCVMIGLFFVVERQVSSIQNLSGAPNLNDTPNPDIFPETPDGSQPALNLDIRNYDQLKEFAKNVREGEYYTGMTVKLWTNIDCGGESFSIGGGSSGGIGGFAGTFDGQGCTISNFSPNEYTYAAMDSSCKAYGLFSYLITGTIKNLRVALAGREISGGDYKAVGGLVGYSTGGTIENCSVQEFWVSTKDKTDRVFVAGIFAVGDATVTNCYVENLYVNNGCGGIAGIGCVFNKNGVWLEHSSKISYCVVKNTMSTNGDAYYPTVRSEVGGTKYSHTVTGCYTDRDLSYSKLAHSVVGGSFNSLYPWYFCAQYEDWPRLRLFIRWQELEFTAVNGTVSKSSIKIPEGANVTYNTKALSIDIYGQNITATGSSTSCHTSAEWSVSGTTHTCSFVNPSWTVTFSIAANVTLLVGGSVKTTEQAFTINCGTTIACAFETFSSRSGINKSITFSFTDSSGNLQTVVYSAEGSKYYITNKTNTIAGGTSNGSSFNLNKITAHDSINISVTTALKSYNMEIK